MSIDSFTAFLLGSGPVGSVMGHVALVDHKRHTAFALATTTSSQIRRKTHGPVGSHKASDGLQMRSQ